jgi:hypothetical protein
MTRCEIHSDPLFLCTRLCPYRPHMASFEVRLKGGTTEIVDGADAYTPDGQLTSFFALGEGRTTVDSWSTRVASFRTAEVVAVRRRLADPASASVAAA